MTRLAATVLAFLSLAACHSAPHAPPEAITPDNKILHRATLSPETKSNLEQNLANARQNYEANPTDEQAIIWLGRRTAYLGRYRQAIDFYSLGLTLYPDSAKLLRHRGHRYITTRRFDEAIADLTRAAALIEGQPDQIEPDGIPNKYNKPRSTLHSNIYYHLALAHYLNGDFDKAAQVWAHDYAIATNDDMRAAAGYWLYLSLRRTGADASAEVLLQEFTPDMDIIENHTYHNLLLSFKGSAPAEAAAESNLDAGVEDATLAYGLAMQALLDGRAGVAKTRMERITDADAWAAFGYIAAEADLRSMNEAASE